MHILADCPHLARSGNTSCSLYVSARHIFARILWNLLSFCDLSTPCGQPKTPFQRQKCRYFSIFSNRPLDCSQEKRRISVSGWSPDAHNVAMPSLETERDAVSCGKKPTEIAGMRTASKTRRVSGVSVATKHARGVVAGKPGIARRRWLWYTSRGNILRFL